MDFWNIKLVFNFLKELKAKLYPPSLSCRWEGFKILLNIYVLAKSHFEADMEFSFDSLRQNLSSLKPQLRFSGKQTESCDIRPRQRPTETLG